MKGDGIIKVRIKYIGLGYKDNNQAYVKIYCHNNLVYEGMTYNGEIYVNLNYHDVYIIEARFYSEYIRNSIYVNRCSYTFIFNHSMYVRPTITLSLRDYYYNLPIEKGELILWKRM